MTKIYNAAVEVAVRHVDDDEVDQLMGQLGAYHPSLGSTARGWLEVRLSLPATSLAQACTTAAAVTMTATGAEAIACAVMTEEEFDAREGFVPIPDLIGTTEAATMLGVSGTRVRQLVDERRIQARTIGKGLVFARAELEAFAARERRVGRPPKRRDEKS